MCIRDSFRLLQQHRRVDGDGAGRWTEDSVVVVVFHELVRRLEAVALTPAVDDEGTSAAGIVFWPESAAAVTTVKRDNVPDVDAVRLSVWLTGAVSRDLPRDWRWKAFLEMTSAPSWRRRVAR